MNISQSVKAIDCIIWIKKKPRKYEIFSSDVDINN